MGDIKCNKCNKDIKKSNKPENKVKCAICNKEYHLGCSSLSLGAASYIFVSNANNCMWACDFCVDGGTVVALMMNQIRILAEKIDSYDMRLKNSESRFVTPLPAKRSWSSMVANENASSSTPKAKKMKKTVTQTDNTSVLVIHSNTDQSESVIKKVKSALNPLSDPVRSIHKTGKGKVVVRCNDRKFVDSIKHKLAGNLDANLVIAPPKTVDPEIKIVGIHDFENNDKFIENIRLQNSSVTDSSKFEIARSYEVRDRIDKSKNKYHTVIVRTDYVTYRNIMHDGKLKHMWDACSVYEYLTPKRCYRCNNYGHIKDNCDKPKPSCPKCAGEHEIKDCTSNVIQCSNCLLSNAEKKLNLPVDHFVWSSNCPTLNHAIQIRKNRTFYGQ